MLRASLFGFPRITVQGKTVQPERKKVLALLVYLLANVEPGSEKAHSRESLATLFWPENESRQAFAYLRHALWELRRLLGDTYLDLEGKSVRLHPEQPLWVDAQIFKTLLSLTQKEIKHLQEAVDLYRGEFLAGFTLPDAPDFDNWQVIQTETFQQLYDGALESLAEGYKAAGDLDTAVAAARRRVELDPLNETAQRFLIDLLACSGQRTAAIRQFEACQHILKEELDLEPEPETFDLYRRICAGELAPVRLPEPQKAAPISLAASLPIGSSLFVGRARELDQVRARLLDPSCQLLTIVGPGGSGKTTLALQVSNMVKGNFPDGAWFVPLAPVSTVDGVVSTLEAALQISSPDRAANQTGLPMHLITILKDKHLLLLVDNLEHLRESIPFFHILLRHTPGVKILATSRVRLNLPAEWVVEIGGLSSPGAEGLGIDEIKEFESVQLFTTLARRFNARFEPTGDDWQAIQRICHQVDGLPLGLELAAAWVRVLQCQDIALEMARTLDFLSTDQPVRDERQRSLRATFAYSWNLLSESERAAFRRLAVFRGGFDHQAAAQVAGVPLSALASLIDQSLIQRLEDGRFDLHQVLKNYALEQLETNAEESRQLRNWHSDYYLARLADWFEELKGARQEEVLRAVRQEHANLLVAWIWAVEQQHTHVIRKSVMGLFLIYNMGNFTFEMSGAFDPAIQLARQVQDQTLLVLLLAAQRWHLVSNPRYASVYEAECLKQLQSTLPSIEKAYAQVMLASGPRLSSAEQFLAMAEDSTAFLDSINDDWGSAIARLVKGDILAQTKSDYQQASLVYEQSLAQFSALGNPWGQALCLNGLSIVAEKQGNLVQAAEWQARSLPMFERLGDYRRMVDARLHLAYILLNAGDRAGAQQCLESNLAFLKKTGWTQYDELHLKWLAQIQSLK